ncbi:MAG: hypothetical protein ACR2P5_08795 [Gammaproteobacteria bacterium]
MTEAEIKTRANSAEWLQAFIGLTIGAVVLKFAAAIVAAFLWFAAVLSLCIAAAVFIREIFFKDSGNSDFTNSNDGKGGEA